MPLFEVVWVRMLEGVGMPLMYSASGAGGREQRRPMWTQHEKAVLRLLMRQYAGVTEFDPPDVHKHPIRNEMWRLLTARYNAHPHVRSRDTKQLRKAWENLKYRARKLGSESQRSGRQQNNSSESSWPLDGVTLPGPTSPPTQNPTPTPREAGEVGDWRESEEESSQRNLDDTEEPERDVNDEADDDPVQSHEGLGHAQSLGERTPAVLNLHPLVSSLLGGGLGSLATTLPFLAASPSSHLATGLLLPHAVSSFSTGDSELCQTILKSSMDTTSITSTSPTTATSTPTAATSDTCISTSGASIPINGISQAIPNTFTTSPSATSATADKPSRADVPAEPLLAQDRIHQRLAGVETTIRHTEEQHHAQLQLLRLQMAQSVAEHEAKMRVLGAQLEYWQRRLRVQQRVSNALTAITQNDPDLEDEPPA